MPGTQFIIQLVVYLAALLALTWPMGRWLAAVAEGRFPRWMAPVVRAEQAFYRLAGIADASGSSWIRYVAALIAFNTLGVLVVHALQRFQGMLPFNPQHMSAVSADSAFDTAVSFVTNTDWQGYAGESTLSYLTQMLALTTQNFFSAATGIAVVWALIRGFAAHSSGIIGNFWVDVTRATVYVLLPLSSLFAIFLVSQGSIQNLDRYKDVATLEVGTYRQPRNGPDGQPAKDCQRHAVAGGCPGPRRNRSRWARSPRRKPSRCSAPMAAASSTPIRRTLSRIRRRSRTSRRCWRSS